MDNLLNIGLALIGIAFIFMGILGREFYWARSLEGIFPSDRRAPTWAGRLLFLILGVLALIISIKQMVS